MPSSVIGDNGADFLRDSLFETAFCYGVPQKIRPSDRDDDLHYDGGASLLHMCISIWGRRGLKCYFAGTDRSDRWYEQKPGCVYIGNLCTVQHQVKHYSAEEAGPLYKPPKRIKRDAKGLLITVMLRSDFFRGCQSRQKQNPPTPQDVFNIVNDVEKMKFVCGTIILVSSFGVTPRPCGIPADMAPQVFASPRARQINHRDPNKMQTSMLSLNVSRNTLSSCPVGPKSLRRSSMGRRCSSHSHCQKAQAREIVIFILEESRKKKSGPEECSDGLKGVL